MNVSARSQDVSVWLQELWLATGKLLDWTSFLNQLGNFSDSKTHIKVTRTYKGTLILHRSLKLIVLEFNVCSDFIMLGMANIPLEVETSREKREVKQCEECKSFAKMGQVNYTYSTFK